MMPLNINGLHALRILSVPDRTTVRSSSTNTHYERAKILRKPKDRAAGIAIVKELRSEQQYIEKYSRDSRGCVELEGEAIFLRLIGSCCPNIVQLRELFTESKESHMIVEYMDGHDLSGAWEKKVDKMGAFSEHYVWTILRDISNALRYLETGQSTASSPRNPHWQPILHADIKPHNIALSRGKGWKLIDFGAAVVMQSKVQVEQHGYGGTFYWIPPEWPQINGLKADIWALGVVIHELCTFDYPRDLREFGHYATRVSYQTLATAPVRVHNIAVPHTIWCHNVPGLTPYHFKRGYTTALRDIMYTMLSSDPVKRPSGALLNSWANQFFAAVDRIKESRDITEFDEAISILANTHYKRTDIEEELTECVSQENTERDQLKSRVPSRMIFACYGFQSRG